MDPQATPRENLQELRTVLQRIVKRMTHQIFSTPLQTQMDVGTAISLVNRVHFPRQPLLLRALPDLLRELGKRRPDLHRYIVLLEGAAREIGEQLERPDAV